MGVDSQGGGNEKTFMLIGLGLACVFRGPANYFHSTDWDALGYIVNGYALANAAVAVTAGYFYVENKVKNLINLKL